MIASKAAVVDAKYKKEIPMSYVPFEGKMIPQYPRASASPSLTIERDAINRVLSEISEGDNDKNSYSLAINI